MTKKDALKVVEEIKAVAGDDEAAHAMEDQLREMFISDVAKRKDGLGEVARIVLLSGDIEFERWCA